MDCNPSYPQRDIESRLIRRDPDLYDSLGAIYLSPADGFNRLAPTYDQRLAGNPLLVLESTATLAALTDIRGKVVADVGCGTGRYTLQLARMGAESVFGVDLSEEMLAVASRKAERGELSEVIHWRRGDILERLPIADGAADLVVCALTLSFLPDMGGAFRELSRILSPGGSLVVSDYHPHGLTQTRAEALSRDGNKGKAPYLRFTSADGDDCRIAQYPHTVSDLFEAGREAGMTLDHLCEPVADRRVSNSYNGLQGQNGVPLAIIARFQK